jgi:hypothetical protein
MNRWHTLATIALAGTVACTTKSAAKAPTTSPAELPHLALNTTPPVQPAPTGVQTAEAPGTPSAVTQAPAATEEEPSPQEPKQDEETLPRAKPFHGSPDLPLPRLPPGDPRRGTVTPAHADETEAKQEKTEGASEKKDEAEPDKEKGPIVQARVVGGEQRLRFENGEAITQLVKGGALQLIAFVSVGGTGRHYAYSEAAGLLPMPEAAYTALVEQGRVLELPSDPTVRSELKVGDSSQYTIAVGDVIEHRLATALADASGGANRSIAVVDESGNVRVALARR